METFKAYGAKFSRRTQKAGEKVEDYAADLKAGEKVEDYAADKAYPSWDERTRKEDLVRKFLYGLFDEKVRF